MTRHPTKRFLALLTAAAVLATMTAATVASPAAAAKPKCQGKVATIVGTNRSEVIRGTAKRDIIVARGGNDRIYGRGGNDIICAGGGNDTVYGGPGADRLWGQLGRDRLLGNAGPDFLAGQVGNDTLVGGIGVDTCFQGTGLGPVSTCERPAPPAPPPASGPPAPPASGPTLVPLDGILAVAYTDMNGNGVYDTDDVLIAKLVDTVPDGEPGNGDTIVMDRYPTSLTPGLTSFGDWNVQSHVVQSAVHRVGTTYRDLDLTTADGEHQFFMGTEAENYLEMKDSLSKSSLQDAFELGVANHVRLKPGSPSWPGHDLNESSDTFSGDDAFIEVRLLFDD